MLALRVASSLSKSALARPSAAAFALARPSTAAFFSTKYTKAHEYITLNGKEGTVGITDFAQNSLGDVVFVDLPSVGQSFAKGCVLSFFLLSSVFRVGYSTVWLLVCGITVTRSAPWSL